MRDAGLSAQEAIAGANAAMMHFAKWRSQIEVPQATHETLQQLAKKWPLVAITNGNAQPELFGLGDYFKFVLRAGPDGRSKPFSDMYFLAAEKTACADRRDPACRRRSDYRCGWRYSLWDAGLLD